MAIYRTEILPLSETFVRDGALALRRWRPVLVGERTVEALPLEGLRARAPFRGAATTVQRLGSAALRELRIPRPFVCRALQQEGASLVHAHFGFDGVEAWLPARRLGLPLLVTLHGADVSTRADWFASGAGGRRWKRYPRRLAVLAREERVFFVAVSEHIREAALAAGLPPGRIAVHRLGIRHERFAGPGMPIARRRPVILFVGRLVEKKGVRVLLDAFAVVSAEHPDAELVVAGDGPDRGALVERARDLRNVRFLGAVDRDAVVEQLRTARVFCLPSVTARNGDTEGLPLVILEAQAAGVPVVTSARGGATEGIEHGSTGLAFPERDVPALAAALSRLLRDDALATAMGERGPSYVAEHHDIERQAAELERLYDRLAGRFR